MSTTWEQECEERMQKSVGALQTELAKLRTGRANVSLLEHIQVESYGAMMPLNQVATVTVENARTLMVTPWDKTMVAPIEKVIMSAGLGLNPQTAGMVIRVPMPPLTEDRRRAMAKLVREEGERARVAVRNIRRDANGTVKSLVQDKELSEDDERRAQAAIQKITDRFVSEIDQLVTKKEADLMEV